MKRYFTFFSLICCLQFLLLPLAHGRGILHEQPFPIKLHSQSKNKIFFTFDSPDSAWTEQELAILKAAINDFYPVIESIYGEPAFTINVNIRKDPSIIFAGEYSPSTKEIALRNAEQLDVLCHEMIHAFRDENMILINSFEEGMTRAVEVEVFNRLSEYSFWNENHSYMYDVYYEGLNRQVIGSQSGNFDYASPFLLLRYDLSGYAWTKVFLENPYFFADFNRKLYDMASFNPSALSDISALRGIAASLQPFVEGKPFSIWYEQQGIFDPAPGAGYFVYQNISNFNVYHFFRDEFGAERMIENATIDWEIYGHEDNLLLSGSGVTSSFGWFSIDPVFPAGYEGRIKIIASANTPSGIIHNTAVTSIGSTEGIFGILENNDAGAITITHLDSGMPATSVNVLNGMFHAPSLAPLKGRFMAVYSGTDGLNFAKQFNKDASDYFLTMTKNDSMADLSLSLSVAPTQGSVGNILKYTLTTLNKGPDAATDVFLTDILPPGVTFVSASPSQGICTSFSSTVACALNTITGGAMARVYIVAIPGQTGTIENNACVTSNMYDKDMTNNCVVLSSTVVDITPAIRKIVDLMNKIQMLYFQNTLNRGQSGSLIRLLQSAKSHCEEKRTIPAINQIEAFTKHVSAYVRAGTLSGKDGGELNTAAESVIAILTLQHQAPLT